MDNPFSPTLEYRDRPR